MPRAYGYAPLDAELYKTEAEKDAARQKMFDSMDLKSTGVITFDEWFKFCEEHMRPRWQPWILTPSLTKDLSTSSRLSSKLPWKRHLLLRESSFTGTCWRSSPIMIQIRMESSNWLSFPP